MKTGCARGAESLRNAPRFAVNQGAFFLRGAAPERGRPLKIASWLFGQRGISGFTPVCARSSLKCRRFFPAWTIFWRISTVKYLKTIPRENLVSTLT